MSQKVIKLYQSYMFKKIENTKATKINSPNISI